MLKDECVKNLLAKYPKELYQKVGTPGTKYTYLHVDNGLASGWGKKLVGDFIYCWGRGDFCM